MVLSSPPSTKFSSNSSVGTCMKCETTSTVFSGTAGMIWTIGGWVSAAASKGIGALKKFVVVGFHSQKGGT